MQEDTNYCVYVHRNKRTNEVFYVGSGRLKRSTSHQQRNTDWKNVVKSDGFYAEIVNNNLTKEESLVSELRTYEDYSTNFKLVNKFPPRPLNNYPVDILQACLYYDETSPTVLRRKIDSPSNKGGTPAKAGDSAGSKSRGQRLVKVLGKQYLIHRVVWILHGRTIPFGWVIDHIDGDQSNNMIDNLRAITQAENCRNQKLAKNNKSGVVGVNLHKHGRGKSDAWKAQYVNLSGDVVCKSFTISIFGNDLAFKLACEYRERMIQEMNTLGAGYTTRHGT